MAGRKKPPIEYRSQSAVATAFGSSLAVAKPTGTEPGDLLVVFGTSNAATTINMPGGWTTIVNDTAVADSYPRYFIAYKKAGASEPSSYTFTWSGQFAVGLRVIAYKNGNGVDTVGTPNKQNTTSYVATSITTTKPGILLFFNTRTAWATDSGPSGMTMRYSTVGPSVDVWEVNPSPAGATGNKTIYAYTATAFGTSLMFQIY